MTGDKVNQAESETESSSDDEDLAAKAAVYGAIVWPNGKPGIKVIKVH